MLLENTVVPRYIDVRKGTQQLPCISKSVILNDEASQSIPER